MSWPARRRRRGRGVSRSLRRGHRGTPPTPVLLRHLAGRQADFAPKADSLCVPAITHSGFQPIPHARLGEQQYRAGRIGLQLMPELSHDDAKVLGVVDVSGAPDGC